MDAARIPNMLIVIVALAGVYAIARSCVIYWRLTSTISKAAQVYTVVALLFNAALHVARIAGTVAPNSWFLTAVVLLVSSITMSAIIGTGIRR